MLQVRIGKNERLGFEVVCLLSPCRRTQVNVKVSVGFWTFALPRCLERKLG